MVRDWSEIAPTSWLGWTLRLPLRLIPKQSVVRVRSGINHGMRWAVGSSIHGCWLGTYELEKQRAIARFIEPGMTVFDLGANAGYYTLAFSRLVGDRGRVYAFEPYPENAYNLLRHIALNRLRNVTVFTVAITACTGVVGFKAAASNSMGTIDSEERSLQVPTVSLDELVAKRTIPPPDLVKMDVEGAESLVLEGARCLLQKGSTIWFVALHGQEQWQRCRTLLTEGEYATFCLDGTSATSTEGEISEIYALPERSRVVTGRAQVG